MIIGVTGGIGTGKSTACRILAELGLKLIDVDQIYHGMLIPGSDLCAQIRAQFGPEYFTPEGRIDRECLGETVFADPPKMRLLGAITHPRIRDRVQELLRESRASGKNLVIDHPLLFEMKMEDLVDEVWVVALPLKIQIERLMKRNNLSRAKALERIRAQAPLEEKISRADVVIDNSGTKEDLRKKMMDLWKERFE